MPARAIFSDDTEALAHYGVLGMKWGVRRYENKDGTLTAEGKTHKKELARVRNVVKSTDAANSIVDSLSKNEKDVLGAEGKHWVDPKNARDASKNIIRRIIQQDESGNPVGFLEIENRGNRIGQVSLATRSGDAYRGKGHASSMVDKAVKWFDRYGYAELDALEWIAHKDNKASISLAEKHGFKPADMKEFHPDWDDYPDWKYYVYRKGERR